MHAWAEHPGHQLNQCVESDLELVSTNLLAVSVGDVQIEN